MEREKKLEHTAKRATKPRPHMDQYTPKMSEEIGVPNLDYKAGLRAEKLAAFTQFDCVKSRLLQQKEEEKQRRMQIRIGELLEEYFGLKKEIDDSKYQGLMVSSEKLT